MRAAITELRTVVVTWATTTGRTSAKVAITFVAEVVVDRAAWRLP